MNTFITIDNKYILSTPSYYSTLGKWCVNVLVVGKGVVHTAWHEDRLTAIDIAVSHVNELVSKSKH